jgi:hypothetical protein
MFHVRPGFLAALGTRVPVVEPLGMLPLHELVVFGGHNLAQFVPGIFDLRPRRFDRWPIGTILLSPQHAAKFLNLLEYFGREASTTFFDSF